jgi:hypothetical protein
LGISELIASESSAYGGFVQIGMAGLKELIHPQLQLLPKLFDRRFKV